MVPDGLRLGDVRRERDLLLGGGFPEVLEVRPRRLQVLEHLREIPLGRLELLLEVRGRGGAPFADGLPRVLELPLPFLDVLPSRLESPLRLSDLLDPRVELSRPRGERFVPRGEVLVSLTEGGDELPELGLVRLDGLLAGLD